MIELNTLRRGNLINYKKAVWKVRAISDGLLIETEGMSGGEKKMMEKVVTSEEVFPILITEKQLGHLHFKKFERPYGDDFQFKHICIYRNPNTNPPDPFLYTVHLNTHHQLKSEQVQIIIPCTSVHQVQNLCFELNCEIEYDAAKKIEASSDKKIISR